MLWVPLQEHVQVKESLRDVYLFTGVVVGFFLLLVVQYGKRWLTLFPQ